MLAHQAHRLVRRAVRQGCSACASTFRLLAHHDDYSKPLDVIWLCDSCHQERHRKLGWGIGGRKAGGSHRALGPYTKRTTRLRDAFFAWKSARPGRLHHQFARALGVRERDLSRWLNGHSEPSRAALWRIASLTGVAIEWLMCEPVAEAA